MPTSILALSLLLLLGAAGPCVAIERPKYSVEISEKPFEVRRYAPAVVACVRVTGARDDAVNAGFRILAAYIFGDNRTHSKISMTAPVTQSATQAISMTAPVTQSATQDGWDVRFNMPAAYTLSTLPIPLDSRVQLIALPARRMAAITFSGFWSDSNLQSHQAQLLDLLTKHRLTARSSPVYAYYDPPWTPWFLRTNEVLVELE